MQRIHLVCREPKADRAPGRKTEHCVVRASSRVQISLCKASLGSVTALHVTQVSTVVFSDKLSKGQISPLGWESDTSR